MTIGDWLIIVAILLGPILAVQVQKRIESWREDKTKKLAIFKILMTSRKAVLSPAHVEALNMIDLEFSVKNPNDKRVLEAWNLYRDHLYSLTDDEKKSHSDDEKKSDFQNKLDRWIEKKDELLIELLYEMSSAVGYEFNKVDLKRGDYTPIAYGNMEAAQAKIIDGVLALFDDRKYLPVRITSANTPNDIVSKDNSET